MFFKVFQIDIWKAFTNSYVLLELQGETIWALNKPTSISVIYHLIPVTLETWDKKKIGNPISDKPHTEHVKQHSLLIREHFDSVTLAVQCDPDLLHFFQVLV